MLANSAVRVMRVSVRQTLAWLHLSADCNKVKNANILLASAVILVPAQAYDSKITLRMRSSCGALLRHTEKVE